MVAGCPKCSARYRVDPARIGPDGAKLRCTKCSAVFLVRAPKSSAGASVAASAEPAEAKRVAPPVVPVVSAPAQTKVAAPSLEAPDVPERAAKIDPARLVIVADPDEARGKISAEAIESWGLTPHLVLDGVEAMLSIQRMLPAAVVLDAALPKMFGFQVCEVIKRNESLRHTRVVLVGAVHHQGRYRRGPSELYGADVYIEQPDLPDGLRSIFEQAGLPIGESPAPVAPRATDGPALQLEEPSVPPASEGTPEPEFEFESNPLSQAPQPVVDEPKSGAVNEDPKVTEERERALRLARIAVSEMLLYSPEKFERAIRDGNLEQVLDLEIQEARALLRQRISERVRAETDFIIDELNRVAADRGR